jgi:hypothetical protein
MVPELSARGGTKWTQPRCRYTIMTGKLAVDPRTRLEKACTDFGHNTRFEEKLFRFPCEKKEKFDPMK